MSKLHLITGYMGEEHIQSADQGSFNASFFGGGEFVMEAGNQFDASIMDNNTVRILDGDVLMKGRHLRIEPKTYADVTIETGTAGVNRNDLIVFQYSKDTATGIESSDIVVIKGAETSGKATDPTYTDGDILGGATFNQMPMYRVKVEGVVLVGIEPLFTVIPTYKTLAERYARQFQEACDTYIGLLNILDTMEEVEANTQEGQLAGALALKEVIASIFDIVNNQVTTRYDEDTDMWQMKTVSDGVWHDWASGGLLSMFIYDSGNAYHDITGGYINGAQGTLNESDNGALSISGSNITVNVKTTNTFDISRFSKCRVTFNMTANATTSANFLTFYVRNSDGTVLGERKYTQAEMNTNPSGTIEIALNGTTEQLQDAYFQINGGCSGTITLRTTKIGFCN
jgi:hypothetical protein